MDQNAIMSLVEEMVLAVFNEVHNYLLLLSSQHPVRELAEMPHSQLLFGTTFELILVWQVLGMPVQRPFRRMTYAEAMTSYGCDKPDLRYGLEHYDVSSAVQGCTFRSAGYLALTFLRTFSLACAHRKM